MSKKVVVFDPGTNLYKSVLWSNQSERVRGL